MDQLSTPPAFVNEPIGTYAPGTRERAAIAAELELQATSGPRELVSVIDGHEVRTGSTFEVRAPHDHGLHLGTAHAVGVSEVHSAIGAAVTAHRDWSRLPWDQRAAVFLRAADLLASSPWRERINAATMLGQSKTVHQAEIDSACELIDFLRFNVSAYAEILAEQPLSSAGVWNRTDWRPLEGFVLALTPFNFTAIAGNLPAAPAMLGNTVVWKPSEKQALAAQVTMDVFRAAGLPDGVINLVHGDGALVSRVCIEHHWFAGLHFTGSAGVFQQLQAEIGANISGYRAYPRVVGETGGKDFVVAHPSARPDALVTALVRGAFEYQGQKCSAASRAYVPRTLWEASVRDLLAATTESLSYGDVRDLTNFGGAVIDRVAFDRHTAAFDQAAADDGIEVVAGGTADDADGYFVRPTVLRADDPRHDLMSRELFGPILTVHVWDDTAGAPNTDHDAVWKDVLRLVDTTSPYALTGAIWSQERGPVNVALDRLRQAAGNVYVNDKPTGAVVGQQPFGGARASGTNDKAGSKLNLYRWLSARSVKETFDPPTDHTYPHMSADPT